MSQQLVKKGTNGRYSNVMPKSWIEAIKDKNTGKTLIEILQSFNMYFLPYDGNSTSTRCLVPTMLRKKGLWITYVKYDGNMYTEWYATDKIDDKSWGDSSNWRIGNNTLVGDITISANGNWVINGTETEFKAVGEKGNTPLVRFGSNNKFQVSYSNGEKWVDISDSITNNLGIKKYIGINESLPTSGVVEGTIYMKGPYYSEDDTLNNNPIYRMWVYAWKDNILAWQDNGEFTSIVAGIVQETGDSETEVMSQKSLTKELSKLESNIKNNQVSLGTLGVHKIIYDKKIMHNGAVDVVSGMNIILFKVEPEKAYRIFNNIIGTTNTPSYAVYSSENLSESSILVTGEPINTHTEDTYITTPNNSLYIAIQQYNSDYGVYETENIQKAIPSIINSLNNIDNEKIGYGNSIKSESSVQGYIYYDGSIDNNAAFTTYLYPVLPNTQYWVYSTLRSGISKMYSVYSSKDLSVDTVLAIGIAVNAERDDYILVTTPENAAYIAVSSYGGSSNAVYTVKDVSLRDVDKEVQSLKEVIEASSSKGNQRMIASLDKGGENLFIAYLDESLTEYVYWFKKCMFNELYTFYRVGYRKVERGYPTTEGIESLNGVTIINSTSSDNIGPILFKNGRWSGGNHSWNSDNVTKTARTESYAIYVDGVEIKAGESKYADKVVVKVVNTIFNPAVLPSSIVPISTESVDYSVVKNTIEVSVKQQFADINNPVDRYYGMQSMFVNEQKLLIPNGGVDEWIDTPSDYFIEKSLYPKVNRFIERNDSIGFQSAYLKPNKDGNHQMVATTIFNHSYSKSYHYIIDGETNVAGKKVVWSGAYSFFDKPIQDDSNVFVYSGVINGKDAVYINTKKAFEGSIELPSKYLMKKIQVIEKDDTISTTNEFVDSEGIEVNASGTGSMIVLLD